MLEFIIALAVYIFLPPLLFAAVVMYLFLCELLWAMCGGLLRFARICLTRPFQ